jgi:hypothetical protein
MDHQTIEIGAFPMSKKPPSLASFTLNKPGAAAPIVPQPTAIASSNNSDSPEEKRIGQTLRLPPGAHKQLKRLAVDIEKPVHDLLIEAVNDLFSKYGKPPIA